MARGTTSYYGRRYTIATPMTHLYMLCACIFCWIVGYVDSVGYPVYGEVTAPPLWNALCLILPGKLFTYLIGFLLMAGGAFLVHRVNYALMLIREKTLLPFLFYALLTSTNPDFFPLKSTSVGVFCLILALYQLFTSYHDPDATDKAYNASLIISIGSLLWIHILWFLPLFWLGMYNFRTLNIRTFVASLFGILTVYWFVFGWCVWEWDFTVFTIPFTSLFKIRFLAVLGTGIIDWIQIVLVAGLTIIASLNIVTHEYEDNLRTRQFLSFLIVMAIWSFGLFFIYEQSSEEFLEMACVPASILIALFFYGEPGEIYLLAVPFLGSYVYRIINDTYMEFLIAYGYIGVFIASFLAATILPFSSEVVLTGVLLAGSAYWPCMIAATLGNFLGGMSCYWLGMLGKVEWIEKYLKLDPVKLQKVQDWIKGKGSWMGFFVFLPGIGDFIAVALGFLRANIWVVAISMFLGKAIRYWVWMEFVYRVQSMF